MRYFIEVLLILIICGVNHLLCKHRWESILIKEGEQKKKIQSYYNLLLKWKLTEHDRQRCIAQKLLDDGHRKVAVYGMSRLGWIVCNDLMSYGVEVAYAIDQNAEKLACNAFTDIPDVKLNLPDDKLDDVDVIIVTVQFGYREIKEKLESKYLYKVLSLEELVDSL